MKVKSSRKGVLSNVSGTCATDAQQSKLKSDVKKRIMSRHKKDNSFLTRGTSNVESENKPQLDLKSIIAPKLEKFTSLFSKNPLKDLGIIPDVKSENGGSGNFLNMLSNFVKKLKNAEPQSKRRQTLADYDYAK